MSRVRNFNVHRAYKHRLDISPSQEKILSQWLGCGRLIYNLCLERNELQYELSSIESKWKKSPSYEDLTKDLTELRHIEGYEWLKEPPVEGLRNKIKDSKTAFRNFFEQQQNYPQYKSKRCRDSLRLITSVRTNDLTMGRDNKIKIPKIGWIRVQNSYPDLEKLGLTHTGEFRSLTITKEADGYYVSIMVQTRLALSPEITPIDKIQKTIGVDAGINNSFVTSEGDFFSTPVITDEDWKKLGKLQSKLNRCQQGSRNREKARQRLAKHYQYLTRRKEAYLHVLSKQLVRNYDLIVLENLDITNMSRNTSGTLENPGTNVSQKSGLNREILNQSWGKFKHMVEYKAKWAGKEVLLINPAYTSQECFACGYTTRENRENQAVFSCKKCSHTEHADLNASRNIRKKGIKKYIEENNIKLEIAKGIGFASYLDQNNKDFRSANAAELAGSCSIK